MTATLDHSIKTLAKHLGFQWRDAHPSGAASIEWFDRWVRTRDQTIKQRILDYNEVLQHSSRLVILSVTTLHVKPKAPRPFPITGLLQN